MEFDHEVEFEDEMFEGRNIFLVILAADTGNTNLFYMILR